MVSARPWLLPVRLKLVEDSHPGEAHGSTRALIPQRQEAAGHTLRNSLALTVHALLVTGDSGKLQVCKGTRGQG